MQLCVPQVAPSSISNDSRALFLGDVSAVGASGPPLLQLHEEVSTLGRGSFG